MKKNTRIHKMSLRLETVRRLAAPQLEQVDGGSVSPSQATACGPTLYYTCHINTPSCPM
jgi:hypothetical protein